MMILTCIGFAVSVLFTICCYRRFIKSGDGTWALIAGLNLAAAVMNAVAIASRIFGTK